MTKGGESKNHHWWPTSLQSYWQDSSGKISVISPDGSIKIERRHRGEIGKIFQGHTLLRESPWKDNFEDEFKIDTKVHHVIDALKIMVPDGNEKGIVKYFHIDENTKRNITLFILSLVIRSPSQRDSYEKYPAMMNLSPNENVGKANMRQNYSIARRLCEHGSINNIHFTLLHSEEMAFIYGDGCLDWLSSSLISGGIKGRALIALTPHLCVYINTPMSLRRDRNCAAIRATRSMIERSNEITQIYSKEQLFFLGDPPELTAAFQRGEFLQHATFTEGLFDELDELVGNADGRPSFLDEDW